jgi:hypothetical protein
MNKKERSRIDRLYDVIEKVPLPISGTRSTTIASISGYTEDMREFMPAVKAVLMGIMAIDSRNEELVEDEDYKNPDELLTAIEKWIAVRNAEDWRTSVLSIMSFYKVGE